MNRDGNKFSLKASVFERYMLLDDRPSHPMSSFLEVDFRGEISREQLENALPAALVRHPLLNSIVREDPHGECRWEVASAPSRIQLLKQNEHPPRDLLLNLRESPGLRIWLRPGFQAEEQTVILLVHHATSDALGMLTFFMEWLVLATGQGSRLGLASVHELGNRENFGDTPPAFPLQRRLRNITRYLFGKSPETLALPDPYPHDSPVSSSLGPESSYHVVRFSKEESQHLRMTARQQRASLNDLLTAGLFLTVQDWNRHSRTFPSLQPWRIVVPVNRRSVSQRMLSACNLIGYKMLTRGPELPVRFVELLHSIREEMEPVRRHPQGVYQFVRMLRFFDRFGLLHRTVQRYDCFATVILSNLGDLSRYFGNLLPEHHGLLTSGPVTITGIRCAPPRRQHSHATIVAVTYGRELQLISSRISPGLDDVQTRTFLERFRMRLLQEMGKLNSEAIPTLESGVSPPEPSSVNPI